jgi:hypothetical protein
MNKTHDMAEHLRASRWIELQRIKHACNALTLEPRMHQDLNANVLENISRAQAHLNLAIAMLEGQGV